MRRFIQAVATQSEVEDSYFDLGRILFTERPCPGPSDDAWQNQLLYRILTDENALTISAAGGRVPQAVAEAAAHDLRQLQALYSLTGDACRLLARQGRLPAWPGWPEIPMINPAEGRLKATAALLAAAPDWGTMVPNLIEHHRQAGFGVASAYWCLRWEDGHLQGIAEPDLFNVDNLVGLREPKATVFRNTEQFLNGISANNLLLYGSRGTGKSSLVRGLATRYGERGLRLVEVNRPGSSTITGLFRILKGLPQRFIIFLDDLSFDEVDNDCKAFKSMVEGALEQSPANVVLYATSNRRHLVPELWSDRNTPEISEVHGQDAMEEKLSLADRFGITVLFPTPNQEEYLAIVEHMVAERGLAKKIDPKELRELALRWILWNNPQSGRTARQFVDDLAGRG